ncbi:hypothetical protein EHF33_09470 [Deinococcus psychrotolerans]|uniref:Uncharacterized protein n=1 Tax=Deinococcus psychrotolerans TaxID=2489213 RepID=A0A3G8YK87_9DEIO|nr:hypothetical protein [Deinococcus psychrotolerans]AZI42944.1 hypothetical protein EHF33_09470 [Deinococcus psychrotolerans]
MTDPKISSDPADTSPAEGQSHPIPAEDKGKGTGGIDTADRADPAEGGRDETPGKGANLSSAADNAEASGRK